MTLVPHLLNFLGKRGVSVHVPFTQSNDGCESRKEFARQLHSEVVRLKKAFCTQTSP